MPPSLKNSSLYFGMNNKNSDLPEELEGLFKGINSEIKTPADKSIDTFRKINTKEKRHRKTSKKDSLIDKTASPIAKNKDNLKSKHLSTIYTKPFPKLNLDELINFTQDLKSKSISSSSTSQFSASTSSTSVSPESSKFYFPNTAPETPEAKKKLALEYYLDQLKFSQRINMPLDSHNLPIQLDNAVRRYRKAYEEKYQSKPPVESTLKGWFGAANAFGGSKSNGKAYESVENEIQAMIPKGVYRDTNRNTLDAFQQDIAQGFGKGDFSG